MNVFQQLSIFFKRTYNMELYLVTIDTTFANKLGKSLQNYGICLASDATMARERFLMPLRGTVPPTVLGELFPYVYAYKLEDITNTISETHPMWSYVSSSNNRELGQQTKSPFFSQAAFQEANVVPQAQPQAPVAPPAPVVEEFKPPEGVTDPVQIALLKTVYELTKEVKNMKAQGAAPAKVSVQDLESRFRAPTAVGDKGLDPRSVPIPNVANVTEFPKGKIDQQTLDRLRQNMTKSRFEDIDEGFGPQSGTN